MLLDKEKKRYEGRSILTLWDISNELFGDSEIDNFKKVREAFLKNFNRFDKDDYINVPREIIRDKFGVTIFRFYGRIKVFPVFTKSGVNKLIEILDMNEYVGALDDLFEDLPNVVEEVEIIDVPDTSSSMISSKIGLKRGKYKKHNKVRVLSNPLVIEDVKNDSLLSEDILSLISYIATSKSLFKNKFCDELEVGTILFNKRYLSLQVISNITDVTLMFEDFSCIIEFMSLIYDKEESKWIVISDEDTKATDHTLNREDYDILSHTGVEFLIDLKSEERTASLVGKINDIKSLISDKNDIQNTINEKLYSLR